MKHITIKLLSTASLLMAAGQVSAHVSYGPALFDGANDASSVLHLATTNLTAQSTQTLTATSNAGNLEDHNATTWGNSHDNKFQWFSISQPTNISFSITGNANNSYTSTITGAVTPIDTLQPAYNLFQGVVPYLSHDGAYQPASVNTGFATWSSWAWESLPTTLGGAGNANSEGNLIGGQTYTADSSALNGQANQVINGSAATSHMGVIGSNSGLVPGDVVTMSNNVSQTTYADGSALTNHTGTLTYITGEAAAAGQTTLNSSTITLTNPGVYTLLVSGSNQADYNQLMTDAIATGMGGSEGYQTNSLGLYVQPNTALMYYDTATSAYTNIASATTQANPAYTGPLGTPVAGFFAAASSTYTGPANGTGPGSSYYNSWSQVEQYAKVDRGARSYTISFSTAAVPVPGAVWLFTGGLATLLGFSRKRKQSAV